MEQLKIEDIPIRNQMRRVTQKKRNGYYKLSPIVYCFDDDGNELGFYTPATPDGLVNTSTAGRQWDDNLKQQLI